MPTVSLTDASLPRPPARHIANDNTPPCSSTIPICDHSYDQQSLLHRLFTTFPTTQRIEFDGVFLIFHVRTLPEVVPRTILGIATYFTLDRHDHGPTSRLKRTRSKSNKVCGIDLEIQSAKEFENHFTLLTSWLDSHGIDVTEIQYWRTFIVIALKDKKQDLRVVPHSFGGLPCYYLFERDMHIPMIESLSRTDLEGCDACEAIPSATTWLRTDGAKERRWIQGRWVWKGLENSAGNSVKPMAGWSLCVSRQGLHELLSDGIER